MSASFQSAGSSPVLIEMLKSCVTAGVSYTSSCSFEHPG